MKPRLGRIVPARKAPQPASPAAKKDERKIKKLPDEGCSSFRKTLFLWHRIPLGWRPVPWPLPAGSDLQTPPPLRVSRLCVSSEVLRENP